MFKIHTPQDIDSYSPQQVLDLVDDTKSSRVKGKTTRMNIIKVVYGLLGFDLTPDLQLALLSEVPRQFILATAGGGKTTTVQLKIILEKIYRTSHRNGKPIDGNRVLCLVYNRHNVDDMKKKHASMVAKLYASGIEGLQIDNKIDASTMHSFCKTWVDEYCARCGLVNYRVISEKEVESLLRSCVNVVLKKHNMLGKMDPSISDLLNLYNYMRETLLPLDEITTVDKFIDLKLPKELVEDIFVAYDKMKTVKRVYDFTDMLSRFLVLLQQYEDVRKRIHDYYEYITADEIQDFTPVMMEILKLITGPETPLVCIGDDDQSIYAFRGADNYNALEFDKKFENGEIYLLERNRRCKRTILNEAIKVIRLNKQRFDKTILPVKEGGNVEYIPFNSREGQFHNICNTLSKMNIKELSETVICYRDRKSSILLGDYLVDNRIPFNVLSGYAPFSHELYGIVLQILDALYLPMDKINQLNLYKALPVTKQTMIEVLKYDTKKKFFEGGDIGHLANIDFGANLTKESFVVAYSNLIKMSNMIKDAPLSEYFPILFEQIKKYHWNYKMSVNNNLELDTLYTSRVYKYFNVNKTYDDFYTEHSKRVSLFKAQSADKIGVTLSTFHGLKGLEFDNVIITDLDDGMFPNFAGIDSRQYDDATKTSLKECETRLLYVAMTRARDNLKMYYALSNPSYYINYLKNMQNISEINVYVPLSKEKESVEEYIDLELEELAPMDDVAITDTVQDDNEDFLDLGLEMDMEPMTSFKERTITSDISLDNSVGVNNQKTSVNSQSIRKSSGLDSLFKKLS